MVEHCMKVESHSYIYITVCIYVSVQSLQFVRVRPSNRCITLYCIALGCVAFHCMALLDLALRCLALHCIRIAMQGNAMQCNAKNL